MIFSVVFQQSQGLFLQLLQTRAIGTQIELLKLSACPRCFTEKGQTRLCRRVHRKAFNRHTLSKLHPP